MPSSGAAAHRWAGLWLPAPRTLAESGGSLVLRLEASAAPLLGADRCGHSLSISAKRREGDEPFVHMHRTTSWRDTHVRPVTCGGRRVFATSAHIGVIVVLRIVVVTVAATVRCCVRGCECCGEFACGHPQGRPMSMVLVATVW